MIEHTIELSRSLSFIGCKSSISKWLEDLSKATSFFKSTQNLENAAFLLEDSHIYELIYPAQSLMSDRLFEEISRRKEDNEPEKLRFREQNNHTKAHGSSEVTTINILSKKEGKADLEKSGLYSENRKKSTGHYLKDGASQEEPDVKLSTYLTKVENEFPVESDVKDKLLRNIINTYGRKIEGNQLGQSLNSLKQVLQSPALTSIEKLKNAEKIRAFHERAEYTNSSESERNSYSIEDEHSLARDFKNFLSEKMSKQFSRHIEGIPASREFLKIKSDEINKSNLIESNQRFEASFAGHLIHDLKSLGSEKQLIENNEFNVSSGIISEQSSRPIKGISVSKESLEEMPGRKTDSNLNSSNLTKSSLSEPNQHSKSIFADSRTHAFKLLKPEKQLIETEEFKINPERISEQFSRHIEGIPSSRELLEKKSGEMTESNLLESSQHSEATSADYLIHDLKSLDSEKQLIENKEFNVSSGRISEQFSRHIEGISVSKRSLEEKLRGNSCQNSYFSAGNTSHNLSDLKSKSNQLSERIRDPFDRNQFDKNQFDRNQFDRNQFDRNQFDKISDSDLKFSENNREPDLLSLTSVNLLIEKAYSNSIKKSDIKEENRELLLNLIENLSQIMNQTNRDTAPKRQNIFNIHVSGESPTGENDLKDLSDRLVLILKDQARRHGIDLS